MKVSACVTSLWAVLDGAQEFLCRLRYHFHSPGFKTSVRVTLCCTYYELTHFWLSDICLLV